MCGILATIGAGKNSPCQHIPSGIDKIKHRGPDYAGQLFHVLPWASVTLGQSRLSISDISPIKVPYTYERLGVSLAYNGEIYDLRELRRELAELGPFETDCDAEVIAAAWRKWGPDCLARFNGMWALVLVDLRSGAVFVARDRAGEKPLFYTRRDGALYFASEIKGLPCSLEVQDCPDLDALEFDFGAQTPFKNVYRLEPGHAWFMASPRDLEAPGRRYWALPADVDEGISWQSAVEKAHELVADAVRLRIDTPIPYAVQLSGGLDSAIIQAVAKAHRLYCVTFPAEGIDNLAAARLAAQGLAERIVSIEFSREDFFEALPAVARHLETPATWTAVCQWHMNKRIAADGARIVLTGEGADELAGGYARYRILWHGAACSRDPLLADYGPLAARVIGDEDELIARALLRGRREADRRRARALIEHYGQGPDIVARAARVDFYTTMQVLLRMGDRMSAAFGLENRAPFLDYRLMEFLARLPTRYKVTDNWNKAILRAVALRLGVDKAIIDEKTKRGLFVPQTWRPQLDGAAWDRRWFFERIKDLTLNPRRAACRQCAAAS
jgi:asparagine synthase (glutamine-hydrolysing)